MLKILKSEFDFFLPPELIAQTPLEPRDSSRMLFLPKNSVETFDTTFLKLPDYLSSGDLLVLNDTKVFPARLLGQKENGINVEILLLKNIKDTTWDAIARPGRRLKKGTVIKFLAGLTGEIIDTLDNGNKILKLNCPVSKMYEVLEKAGVMPTPPYINEPLNDSSRYNTTYAKNIGSAAAPTAGLHFTSRMFNALKEKNIDTAFVTLDIGLGTFRPVKTENILEHKMHSESYFISAATLEKIKKTRQNGGKIVCVGTTSLRVLESIDLDISKDHFSSTDIFIYPGYKFKLCDGLLTNFHLPESTLIMLVCAFCGKERTLDAYKYAVYHSYRFFSFGDCMLII